MGEIRECNSCNYNINAFFRSFYQFNVKIIKIISIKELYLTQKLEKQKKNVKQIRGIHGTQNKMLYYLLEDWFVNAGSDIPYKADCCIRGANFRISESNFSLLFSNPALDVPAPKFTSDKPSLN